MWDVLAYPSLMRLLLVFTLLTATAAAQDIHVKVDPAGPGSTASTTDYTTIQQALDHAPDALPNGRVIISIVPGTYRERINVTRNRPRVTLLGLGKSPEDVVITAAQNAKSAGGTFFTATAEIDGDAFEADNLTIENTAGNTSQAVAAAVRSDRAIFKHVRLLGDQDTLFADFGRQYYVDSYIAGGVDFIFGNATAVFDHDELHAIRPGYLTAQSRTRAEHTTGYVIAHSRVTSAFTGSDEENRMRKALYLGRPWRPYARVLVMQTELPGTLNPAGWSLWKLDDPTPTAFYAEFHNTGPGSDTSKRAQWSHQLTATEAAAYEPQHFLAGTDHWNPVAEAAKLP
jgi:pectinesterase